MAGVWSGFTEEDIGFYQRKSEGINNLPHYYSNL